MQSPPTHLHSIECRSVQRIFYHKLTNGKIECFLYGEFSLLYGHFDLKVQKTKCKTSTLNFHRISIHRIAPLKSICLHAFQHFLYLMCSFFSSFSLFLSIFSFSFEFVFEFISFSLRSYHVAYLIH